ncbi:hypothetical protein J057_11806 [Marinobacter nanhaiticus D15-8W]|uniref:Uncharacterized protein n=1 Tax=Marinobacter nanhaiticus D15-8W TaxID=626887 RepID=N6WWP6_9GAMM|nr:hypothetical protein [Marinobacter nanhaiticus]ENO16036.1 hypothetical protein J057_11806 [Marinobacter nanhaiticus D15-8W]
MKTPSEQIVKYWLVSQGCFAVAFVASLVSHILLPDIVPSFIVSFLTQLVFFYFWGGSMIAYGYFVYDKSGSFLNLILFEVLIIIIFTFSVHAFLQ